MKHCIVFFLLLVAGQSRADGLDEITVFVNGREVFVTTDRVNRELVLDSVRVGDTLTFHVWTDWSMLPKATLLFQTENGKTIRELSQHDFRDYGAAFMYIVDASFLEQKTCFVFHYDEGPVPYWHFAFTDFSYN